MIGAGLVQTLGFVLIFVGLLAALYLFDLEGR